jgi:hypothetical protein
MKYKYKYMLKNTNAGTLLSDRIFKVIKWLL